MREALLSFRERQLIAHPSEGEHAGFCQRHLPTWIISLLAAVLLGGVGAFGTSHAAPLTLYSYWFVLCFAGGATGAWVTDRIAAYPEMAKRPVAAVALVWLVASAAMTPFVYLMAGLALNGSWDADRFPHLSQQTLFVMGVFLALQLFAERRLAAPAAQTSAGPAAVGLSRLPLAMRGGTIWAVEAQDHYLRVHTDRGTALILMKLSDAMAELAEVEGMRTHRSWWVARDAVVHIARGGGRATLTIRSGVRVPVSRTYGSDLRGRGWF